MRTNESGQIPHIMKLGMFLLFLVMAVPGLKAQSKTSEDLDSFKLRLDGYWVYSNPSGDVQGSSGSSPIDLRNVLGYKEYSSFSGRMDWKFARKHHLLVNIIPFSRSSDTVLTKTIVFEGKTYTAGLKTRSELDASSYGFGYQYDIVRRKHGHFGIAALVNLVDLNASISAEAQITGDGVHHAAVSASTSRSTPLPIAGPDFRIYLTDSPHLYVDGHIYGMYFFGYGNFVSAASALGFNFNRHIGLKAGYQVGSRLVITNNAETDRIGLRFTQQGPIAGLEISF
jgi:hypothetical protein